MPASRFARLPFAFLLAVFSALALAQAQKAPSSTYEPSVGQEGKDVVWVPTPQAVVDKMLDMAKVTPSDYVIDLGSGDGRTVITAAKRGARALGIEYNPDMVELSRRNAEKDGVTERAAFMKADLFATDFSKATVITMFLLPEINLKLRPKILALKPGTRIVSNSFKMGEWQADETAELSSAQGCNNSWCTALLWIVPARVAGTHKLPQGELTLKQSFQMLSGTLRTEGKTFALRGKVHGDEIAFKAGGREYQGKVDGNRVEFCARPSSTPGAIAGTRQDARPNGCSASW
jgi:precorrin-6B methylase 2